MIKNLVYKIDNDYLKGNFYLYKHFKKNERIKIKKLLGNAIIIGGCGRSGTSLILSILSSHPKIYALNEETTAFCPTTYSLNLNRNASFEMQKLFRVLSIKNDYIDQHRLCEKTPKNIHFAERIVKYLGVNSRFINIVRDGRDVTTSFHKNDPKTYWISPERWVEDVNPSLFLQNNPQIMTIKYEDLIYNYKITLQKLMSFIDESYHANFDLYPETAKIKQHSAWINSNAAKVHANSISRWKNPIHEKRIMEFYSTPGALELIKFFNYSI